MTIASPLPAPTQAPSSPYRFAALEPGDLAPDFTAPSPANPRFRLNTVAGRYLVLAFAGSSRHPDSAPLVVRVWQTVRAWPDIFDDDRASFFAVLSEPPKGCRLTNQTPGYRLFWDADGTIGRLYGALPLAGSGQADLKPRWVVIDPAIRVVSIIPMQRDGSDIAALHCCLTSLPPVSSASGLDMHAPVLCIPRVFDDPLCARLIAHYDRHGGEESGFMVVENGQTVPRHDPRHKRRTDCLIEDRDLIASVQRRIIASVVPQIHRAHAFAATRMERYLIGCYRAEDGGHFGAHRDNTTPGTAHRRFAASISLNDDFDGGEVAFPEFSDRGMRAPKGAALVFSCSLLHRVSPVRAGRRMVFLPFLYDEAAAMQRAARQRDAAVTS